MLISSRLYENSDGIICGNGQTDTSGIRSRSPTYYIAHYMRSRRGRSPGCRCTLSGRIPSAVDSDPASRTPTYTNSESFPAD